MKRPSSIALTALAVASIVGGIVGTAGTLAADPAPASSPTVPAVSASGIIVFARAVANEEPNSLYTIRPDGTGLQMAAPSFECCDQWSFDGKRILLAADAPDGLRVTTAIIDPDGNNRLVVVLPGASLNLGPGAWTPDGRIVFEGWDDHDTSRNGLYIADPTDITTLKRLTSTTGGDHDFPLSVSRDGARILLMRVAVDPATPATPSETGRLVRRRAPTERA